MFAKGQCSICYRDLIAEVSEESILEYYSGISNVPCVICSPFREDASPSYSIYYSSTGRIWFKDFGTKESYNLITFLMLKLGKDSFADVIDEIVSNIDGIKSIDRYRIKSSQVHKTGNKNRRTTKRELGVKVREWEQKDIAFWQTYGIGLRWLELGNIYPISHIFFDDGAFNSDPYAYCYVEFKDGKPTFKIYQPFSKTWKWLNNHDSSVWDLWTQVMRSNSSDLIITSSRKDALCLWANTGIPSTALQSETTLPKAHVVQQLKNKFKTIWCLYDNDFDKKENYGRQFSTTLAKLYDFKQIEIPEFFKSKDPSDLYKNHGEIIFKQVLNQLLNS